VLMELRLLYATDQDNLEARNHHRAC